MTTMASLRGTPHARSRALERSASSDAYGKREKTPRGFKIRYDGKQIRLDKKGRPRTVINNRIQTFSAPDGTEEHVSTEVIDKDVKEYDTRVEGKLPKKAHAFRGKYKSKVHHKKWKTLEPLPSPPRRHKKPQLSDMRNFNIKYT